MTATISDPVREALARLIRSAYGHEDHQYIDPADGRIGSGTDPRAWKLADAILAALPSLAAPKGWRFVPAELTGAMRDAADHPEEQLFPAAEQMWGRMLAAAPPPPTAEPKEG